MAETQIEFVGSQLCSEMFFSGCSGFPLFDLHSPQLVEHSCSAKSVECRSLVSLDIRPRVPLVHMIQILYLSGYLRSLLVADCENINIHAGGGALDGFTF